MFLGVLKMFFESGSQLFVLSRFHHFGKRYNNLLLSAVEIFQFVIVKVLESFEFYTGQDRDSGRSRTW